MSETKQIAKQATKPEQKAKDIFAVCNENVEKYFDNVESSITKYSQTWNDLQQEFLQAYENAMKTTITLQKEFVTKTGLNAALPQEAGKIIQDSTDAFVKARSLRDQTILATIDVVKNNVKIWNENSKTFADLNKNLLQAWFSTFTVSKTNE